MVSNSTHWFTRLTPPLHIIGVAYAVTLVVLRGGMNPIHFAATSVVFLLATGLWWLQEQFHSETCRPHFSAAILPLSLAWLIAFSQCFTAIVFSAACFEVWSWAVYLLCFVAATSSPKLLHPLRIIPVFAILTTALSAHVLLEAFTGWRIFGPPAHSDFLYRPGSTYHNPNHLANLIVVLTPFFLLGLSSRVYGRFRFCLFGFPLGLGFIAILFAQSRSGLIAFFCALAVWFCIHKSGKKELLGLAAALLACVFAAWSLLGEAAQSHFTRRMGRLTRDDRFTQLWPTTMHMIRAKPIWGWGPGSYAWVYPSYDLHLPASVLRRTHAHNDFLELISQSGLIGGCTIAGLALLAGHLGFRNANRRTRPLLASAAAATTGMLAQSVFDFTLFVPANVVVLTTLTGVVCRGVRTRPSLAVAAKRVPQAMVLSGALLLFAGAGVALWANEAVMATQMKHKPPSMFQTGRLKRFWVSANLCRDWRAPWIQFMAARPSQNRVASAPSRTVADETLLAETIHLNPCWPPAYYSLANTLFSTGRAPEAFAVLERALARFPRDFGLWFQKALAERERNMIAKAIVSYRQALVFSRSEQMAQIIRRDLAELDKIAAEEKP